MTDRLLVDLAADSRVSVSTWLDGELPDAAGAPSDLAWPLEDEALEDLRWYLEDYLRAPYGVYGERGPQIEARLAGWGEAVFEAVFGAGAARDAYMRMRARGAGTEIVFRSPSPELLGLPWELMRDPDRPTPLALDLAGLNRSLPAATLPGTFEVAGGRLRVLMVISRPAGAGDVGYRMIARPLLERLEAVRGQVDLVVLRPPSLQALEQVLSSAAARGEPFQVVHFDGHGVLAGRRPAGAGGPGMFQSAGAEGVLVFQKPNGDRDPVPASRLAQVLKAGQVPVVVLNACQSGAVGKQLEAAVATRLLQEGTASVVAMAYSIYAVAAAEFMAAFYERLFAGDSISAAVSAGRRRLFWHGARPSPKGELPLADWLVPVHYLRREVRFPALAAARPAGEPSLDEALDRLRRQSSAGAGTGLDPVGSFVGRDALFYELETVARLQRVVVLHGPGGTGKTELAKAFGRWWQDTGGVGRPEWVFWHSFEPGVASFGLDGMITEIGLRLFGPDFARLDPGQRISVMRDTLRDRRMLLIWDNFETVRSMPDPAGATPPLGEDGCEELRQFLGKLAADGRSAVIVTSRADEAWLGDVRRIRVGGLVPEDAAEYAEALLAPYPAAASRRARRTFGELMEWLDGHPLSMRLVLPHLETTEPETLLDGLQGMAQLPGWSEVDGDGERTASMAASITYSFSHLATPARRLLAAIGLFQSVAVTSVLVAFSQVLGVPERFRDATRQDWEDVMDQAADVGLLTRLGAGMYRIHPALPAYLAAQWRQQEPADHDGQREAATRALLTAHAHLSQWLTEQIRTGDAGMAFTIIGIERRTLGSLLGYALGHGLWNEARAIALPLSDYWDARGMSEEARAWADRARVALEDPDGTAPALESPAGALWLHFADEQADRQLASRRLDDAERTYGKILAMLQAQPQSPECQARFAALYHQLGRIAQERGRLDDAQDWYEKSLATKEDLGNRPSMASTYGQLGSLAQERGRLDDAQDWYEKCLAINEDLGDLFGMARSYYQLGSLAQKRGRLDDAQDWYKKSLAITQELDSRSEIASNFGQLGLLAETRGQLAAALEWMVRCVTVFEEFPHPATGPGPDHLARLTSMLGIEALQSCWQAVTGVPLPQAVRDYTSSSHTGQAVRD